MADIAHDANDFSLVFFIAPARTKPEPLTNRIATRKKYSRGSLADEQDTRATQAVGIRKHPALL
jgi:hypothetical protein